MCYFFTNQIKFYILFIIFHSYIYYHLAYKSFNYSNKVNIKMATRKNKHYGKKGYDYLNCSELMQLVISDTYYDPKPVKFINSGIFGTNRINTMYHYCRNYLRSIDFSECHLTSCIEYYLRVKYGIRTRKIFTKCRNY